MTHSNLGYAGQYTDPTTGLTYNQARWYDPTTGQFLTQDPLEAVTGHPYSYANDNPISNTDQTGLDTAGVCSSFGGVLGELFGSLTVCGQVDSSGDVGITVTEAGGPGGAGGDVQVGPILVQATNASTISQLDGWFTEVGGNVADGIGGTASLFGNEPGGGCVDGLTAGEAFGYGGAVYAGESYTQSVSINPVHIVESLLGGML